MGGQSLIDRQKLRSQEGGRWGEKCAIDLSGCEQLLFIKRERLCMAGKKALETRRVGKLVNMYVNGIKLK